MKSEEGRGAKMSQTNQNVNRDDGETAEEHKMSLFLKVKQRRQNKKLRPQICGWKHNNCECRLLNKFYC